MFSRPGSAVNRESHVNLPHTDRHADRQTHVGYTLDVPLIIGTRTYKEMQLVVIAISMAI